MRSDSTVSQHTIPVNWHVSQQPNYSPSGRCFVDFANFTACKSFCDLPRSIALSKISIFGYSNYFRSPLPNRFRRNNQPKEPQRKPQQFNNNTTNDTKEATRTRQQPLRDKLQKHIPTTTKNKQRINNK